MSVLRPDEPAMRRMECKKDNPTHKREVFL